MMKNMFHSACLGSVIGPFHDRSRLGPCPQTAFFPALPMPVLSSRLRALCFPFKRPARRMAIITTLSERQIKKESIS